VFGSTEKLVLDLAVAMTKTPPVISDELFAKLQERFTTAQLVELATAIANENLKGRFNRVGRLLRGCILSNAGESGINGGLRLVGILRDQRFKHRNVTHEVFFL
jgi:hypothetical protein